MRGPVPLSCLAEGLSFAAAAQNRLGEIFLARQFLCRFHAEAPLAAKCYFVGCVVMTPDSQKKLGLRRLSKTDSVQGSCSSPVLLDCGATSGLPLHAEARQLTVSFQWGKLKPGQPWCCDERPAALDQSECNNPEASPVGLAARSHPLRYEPHAESGNILSGIFKYRRPLCSTGGSAPARMLTCNACRISFGIGNV